MPKFAQFNPAIKQISPVIGWYDTDKYTYKQLPPTNMLFTLTEAEWTGRFFGDFAIDNGELVQISDLES